MLEGAIEVELKRIFVDLAISVPPIARLSSAGTSHRSLPGESNKITEREKSLIPFK